MIMMLMVSTVKMIYTKLKIFWMKYYIIASYLVCRCVTFENPSVIQSAAGFTLPQAQVKCICLHMRWIYIWHNMMVIFMRVHSPSPVVCRVNPLAVSTWTSKLVPYHLIKSLRFIWRSGTRRYHLRVPHLQMSSRSGYSVEEGWRLRNQFILFVIFSDFFSLNETRNVTNEKKNFDRANFLIIVIVNMETIIAGDFIIMNVSFPIHHLNMRSTGIRSSHRLYSRDVRIGHRDTTDSRSWWRHQMETFSA